MHVEPVGQVLPHAPQFAASLVVLVQTPGAAPHVVGEAAGHAPQTPLVQAAPETQAVPHLPQLAGSVETSTQAVPHVSFGDAQAQMPAVQV